MLEMRWLACRLRSGTIARVPTNTAAPRDVKANML